MDSDSDNLSAPANIPSDNEIEQCLRRVVRDAQKADQDISVNQARAQAEKTLGLETGFLKGDVWKTKSKEMVQAAVDEPVSPEQPKKVAPKPKAGTKRKSDEPAPKTKRQRKSVTPPESDLEDEEEASPEPKRKARSKKAAVSDSEQSGDDEQAMAEAAEESALSEPPEELSDPPAKTEVNGKAIADDESDLSDVIDEPAPAKKKRQKKSTSPAETKAKSKAKDAKPAKAVKESSPDDEEINRLQGWLVKCGIRKVWGKELKKFDTSKQKIKHLKSLLEGVGMTGRYSNEKAKSIKESRELAAEIKAAKDFNEQFGHRGSGDEGEEDDEEKTARPRRLKPKGLIDFGDSGDDDSA